MKSRDPLRLSVVCLALVAGLAIAGCSKKKDTTPPVATPSLALSHDRAPAGSPLELTYKFVVPSDARFAEDYRVFVHVVDTDEEQMWTDDHNPPVPTSQWKPGQTIEYSRTIFVPVFPYVGDATIQMGLHSTKDQKRLTLTGEDVGQHAYRVAKLQLLPQTDNLYVVFKDGWHETEVAEEATGVEWQWSKRTATVAFRNPMRDAVFYLQCDQPVQGLGEPQHVELRIGDMVIDSFSLPSGQRELRKLDLTTAQMGTGETVEITVAVDKTFVPATITQLKSTDSRELGIRVFRAYVQAK